MKRRDFLAMLIGLPVVRKWFKGAPQSMIDGSCEYVATAGDAILDPGDTYTIEMWATPMLIRPPFLSGDFDQVKVFEYALTEEQVRAHYDTTKRIG